MNKNHYLFSFIFLFVTTVSFAQKSAPQEIQSKSPTTTMEFQSETFNWGELDEGEIVQNVFTFTNTGTEPLIISKAKGSCGCTVPRWPKEPIMPGETADLLVQFNSSNKGKLGGAKQSKRVTLTANTEPKNTYLTITGIVHKLTEEEKAAKEEAEEKIAIARSDFDIDAKTVKVFPNPSRGMFNLDLRDYKGQSAMVEVFTMQGKRVLTKAIDAIEGDTINLEVGDYNPGIYTVSIKINGKNRIAKQVILE